MPRTYYPDSNNNRADWWQNIVTVAEPILTKLGFPAAQITSIMADAAWGVYLYRTLRGAYEEATMRVIGYATAILSGPNGTPSPAAPTMPTWPAAPATEVAAGIESRREMWVKAVKSNPGYDAGTMGTTLRIESPGTPFAPTTYVSQMRDLSSPAAKQLRFKFSKAYGEIDGVNLYGRKAGATDNLSLGRYTATPANAAIPIANGAPEEWQFFTIAVKRDIEIGQASPTMSAIIRA
jgi:hypothetical protein